MQLRRRNKHGIEVSTHALNDIMFFLMLFFLIASTMANPNVIKLMLPSSSSPSRMNPRQITLNVDKDLNFYIEQKSVQKDNLKNELSMVAGNLNDATIVVRMDRTLPVQELVDVLEIGSELKLKMILATDKR
jgi:biopolymer transport protein ExbD